MSGQEVYSEANESEPLGYISQRISSVLGGDLIICSYSHMLL